MMSLWNAGTLLGIVAGRRDDEWLVPSIGVNTEIVPMRMVDDVAAKPATLTEDIWRNAETVPVVVDIAGHRYMWPAGSVRALPQAFHALAKERGLTHEGTQTREVES